MSVTDQMKQHEDDGRENVFVLSGIQSKVWTLKFDWFFDTVFAKMGDRSSGHKNINNYKSYELLEDKKCNLLSKLTIERSADFHEYHTKMKREDIFKFSFDDEFDLKRRRRRNEYDDENELELNRFEEFDFGEQVVFIVSNFSCEVDDDTEIYLIVSNKNEARRFRDFSLKVESFIKKNERKVAKYERSMFSRTICKREVCKSCGRDDVKTPEFDEISDAIRAFWEMEYHGRYKDLAKSPFALYNFHTTTNKTLFYELERMNLPNKNRTSKRLLSKSIQASSTALTENEQNNETVLMTKESIARIRAELDALETQLTHKSCVESNNIAELMEEMTDNLKIHDKNLRKSSKTNQVN